ncbi:MAG TPA: cold shock domain-containing protein [Chitinivibrionales bacterium]|nr:cold shock domain-containing protein [Chitinivibrionales bacterium]
MQNGIVKWYNEGQGRGIIVSVDNRKEIPVTHSGIAGDGFKVLFEGQRVTFDIMETSRGTTAVNVEMCGEE